MAHFRGLPVGLNISFHRMFIVVGLEIKAFMFVQFGYQTQKQQTHTTVDNYF